MRQRGSVPERRGGNLQEKPTGPDAFVPTQPLTFFARFIASKNIYIDIVKQPGLCSAQS
jgi:hypothetical protein